jgi:hypothetical protein
MRTLPVAVLVALALAQTVSRAQITVSYNGGSGAPFIADPSGNPLTFSGGDYIGNNVEIGYFDNVGGFTLTPANANNLGIIQLHWHPFDSTNIRSIFGNQGSFARTSPTSIDASFNSKPIDLWVFQTTDGLAANHANFANVLSYGIFSSSVTRSLTTFPWVFPNQGTTPPDNAPVLTTSDVNATQGIFYFGSLGSGGASLQLAPVPEPGTFALLGLGLAFAGILVRRVRA